MHTPGTRVPNPRIYFVHTGRKPRFLTKNGHRESGIWMSAWYSHPSKVPRKDTPDLLFRFPKSSFGEHKFGIFCPMWETTLARLTQAGYGWPMNEDSILKSMTIELRIFCREKHKVNTKPKRKRVALNWESFVMKDTKSILNQNANAWY